MSMREPSFLVLTALAGGRAHGWAVLSDVESFSGGRVRLQVGTLYAVLDRLRTDGFVAVDGEERHQGRLRRYFVLTDDGARVLAAEAEAAATTATAAQRRLAARRPVSTQALRA